jgi:trehalose 6-phosphate phosphatase
MLEPPAALDHLDALHPLKERRGRAGIFLDLDGTLCPLVDMPERVRLPPDTRKVLKVLADLYRSVVIISGRAAPFLKQLVDIPSILYVGNHGLEVIEAGKRRVLLPEAIAERMRRLEGELKASVHCEGALLELKELSHAIHYRRAPEPEKARDTILRELERLDLDGVRITEGKMLIQLRPACPLDKGEALEMIVKEKGLDTVLYAGDDTTDLDAFRELSRLRDDSAIRDYKVAVRHPDTPLELLRAADYRVDGIEEMQQLLRWLLV